MYLSPSSSLQAGVRWLLCSVACLIVYANLAAPVQAGVIGFPAPRLEPWHFRFGILGDSFKTDLKNGADAEATSGRALVRIALGLTAWSEIFAQIGVAEFNLDEAVFSGDFGLAYGGGVRFRLWRFPYGQVGLTAQYLRFTSDGDSVGDPADGEWEEFDVALGVGTKPFGAFQFYGGVAYHENEVTLQLPNSRIELDADIPARIFLGLHIYPLRDFPGGEVVVNFEARLVGETPQFTMGLQYQF
ncbi:MAG: hypothetical protein OEU26_01550 [Candidatus Tectomicrobia bacterium]|nr:hypothetical protein [Candidatus Tectomicrobia bacterium]